MSLFYRSQPLASAAFPALHQALLADPRTLAKPSHEVAHDMAKDLQSKVTGELAIGRVVAAFLLLGVIFATGIWCEHHDSLKRWTDVLFDAFKVGLPGLVGLIIGEASGKSS